jgi:uncharacterized cupredoxin-like copper-binding protein
MKLTGLVVATALAAVALSACGSSSKSASSASSTSTTSSATSTAPAPAAGGSAVALQADPNGALKFDKSQASAKAGQVTITMKNPAALPHGVAIEGNGVSKIGATVGQGGTSTVTATLKPGTYTFYCPVPGHRQAGMQGTLTVK